MQIQQLYFSDSLKYISLKVISFHMWKCKQQVGCNENLAHHIGCQHLALVTTFLFFCKLYFSDYLKISLMNDMQMQTMQCKRWCTTLVASTQPGLHLVPNLRSGPLWLRPTVHIQIQRQIQRQLRIQRQITNTPYRLHLVLDQLHIQPHLPQPCQFIPLMYLHNIAPLPYNQCRYLKTISE